MRQKVKKNGKIHNMSCDYYTRSCERPSCSFVILLSPVIHIYVCSKQWRIQGDVKDVAASPLACKCLS
jgi:hypothetical protein